MSRKKLQLPKIRPYGPYNSDNYSTHALCVDFGVIELYFSYKTLVAFRTIEDGLVIIQNYWGSTTGKHLNAIDPSKSKRLTEAQFKAAWKRFGAKYFDGNPEVEAIAI